MNGYPVTFPDYFEMLNLVIYYVHIKLCILHKKMCTPTYWKTQIYLISPKLSVPNF
jgi:hypothetical protein